MSGRLFDTQTMWAFLIFGFSKVCRLYLRFSLDKNSIDGKLRTFRVLSKLVESKKYFDELSKVLL